MSFYIKLRNVEVYAYIGLHDVHRYSQRVIYTQICSYESYEHDDFELEIHKVEL